MAKGMGINMIHMYCEMVDDEFKPVIAMLEARTAGMKNIVETQVKKDFGVYDLIMKKAALETKLKEIDKQIKDNLHGRWYGNDYRSVVDDEVKRRLEELNQPLAKARETMNSLKKSIKLTTAPGQISGVFDLLTEEVKTLTAECAALPPITKVLRLSNKDMQKYQDLDEAVN